MNNNKYRFYLDNKRAHGFKKGRCPCCNKKDHFTYYIDRDTGKVFNEECGLCDTPGCCHVHPNEWLKQRGESISNLSTKQVEYVPKQTLYIPAKWVKAFHQPNSIGANGEKKMNNFLAWLAELIEPSALMRAYEMYYFGSSREGFTIWWQVDTEHKVRTGKLMLYDENGHRDRTEGKYTFDWMHSKLARKYLDKDKKWQPPLEDFGDTEMVQCLFGLHLLHAPAFKDKKVAIVESEKSAFICSCLLTDYVWMATGGMNGFDYLKVLPIIEAGREMVWFPDLDAYEKWSKVADEIRSRSQSAKIVISNSVRAQALPEDGKKADIADILIRRLQKKRLEESMSPMSDQAPTVLQCEKPKPTAVKVEELLPVPTDPWKAMGMKKGDNEALDLLIEKFDLIPTHNI